MYMGLNMSISYKNKNSDSNPFLRIAMYTLEYRRVDTTLLYLKTAYFLIGKKVLF